MQQLKKPPALRRKTTRLRSKEERGELVIAFRPFIASYVKLIHSDGLHGLTLEETVDRMMCDAIIAEERTGRVAMLMPDGKGGLTRLAHQTLHDDAKELQWFATRTSMLTDEERDKLRRIAARLLVDAVTPSSSP